MAKKQQSVLQKAYRKFFNEKLRKYNITSQSQIKDERRKKQFFNEVKEDWQKRRRRIKDPEQLKGKYTNKYLLYVKRRFNIPKSKLEAGMICELRYSTIDENKKIKPPKKYLVLILNPNYKKYIHCLRIDHIRPYYLKKLVNEVGLETCDVNKKCEKVNLKQLSLDENDSRRFYYKEIKKHMKQRYEGSYRTFIYTSPRTRIINILNFDFTKFGI